MKISLDLWFGIIAHRREILKDEWAYVFYNKDKFTFRIKENKLLTNTLIVPNKSCQSCYISNTLLSL